MCGAGDGDGGARSGHRRAATMGAIRPLRGAAAATYQRSNLQCSWHRARCLQPPMKSIAAKNRIGLHSRCRKGGSAAKGRDTGQIHLVSKKPRRSDLGEPAISAPQREGQLAATLDGCISLVSHHKWCRASINHRHQATLTNFPSPTSPQRASTKLVEAPRCTHEACWLKLSESRHREIFGRRPLQSACPFSVSTDTSRAIAPRGEGWPTRCQQYRGRVVRHGPI